MKIEEKLRQSIFWSIDLIKGGRIKAHYLEIKNIVEFPEDQKSLIKRSDCFKTIMATIKC